MHPTDRLRGHLQFLYGERTAQQIWPKFKQTLDQFKRENPNLPQPEQPAGALLSERDAILITYGDQIREPDCTPLQSLADFMEKRLAGAVSGVHILPFFPYSSDDGFSVVDYRAVDPQLGGWGDIHRLDRGFRLMFDAVINHISRRSQWFEGFLRDQEPYRDFFISVDPGADLSMVVRPRALPLLTAVETGGGTRYVWTTFSDDQIDLNYSNPQVLLQIVDLLLFYVAHGAEIIRLDAIAYLWKEIGTSCIHLPQTHHVVKLFRAVLDAVAPHVILITETNVPHKENVSYFGEMLPGQRATDEAQLVYQFPLAPLVLHTFHTGSAAVLKRWAASLETPSPATTFLNFIASHDGIGVRPAEGLLTTQEIQALVDRTLAHGGQVSYKANADGTRSVYELNITLYDILNNPQQARLETDVRRFLASQVMMLSLAGVPGIYVHSLFGSPNCQECLQQTGRARSINRQKFTRQELEHALDSPTSRQARVFHEYIRLLRLRRAHPAFSPQSPQKVLESPDSIFALARASADGSDTVLCLVNVSNRPQRFTLHSRRQGLLQATAWKNLIDDSVNPESKGQIELELDGCQYAWLIPLH